MSIGTDYPVVSTGSTLTSIDTFDATKLNNGAQNLLGQVYVIPLNADRVGAAANGMGLQKYVKYVRYNPTVSQAILTGPGIVYWKDETFTTVTGLLSESFTGNANSVAGWLQYNTTTLATATAAQINGNFCFIAVGGFLAGAVSVAATAVGDTLFGLAGAFTVNRVAAGTAFTFRPAAYALTAVAAGLSDLYIPFLN
jgi:hypothetical protein